jgi:hypothetical protein
VRRSIRKANQLINAIFDDGELTEILNEDPDSNNPNVSTGSVPNGPTKDRPKY